MTARLVYSSGPDGEASRRKEIGPARAVCREIADHDLRVRRERSGRKGKTVTIAGWFHRPQKELTALVRRLKRRCGAGGALLARDDGFEIEVQGDHVDLLLELLAAEGYPGKRSGG